MRNREEYLIKANKFAYMNAKRSWIWHLVMHLVLRLLKLKSSQDVMDIITDILPARFTKLPRWFRSIL